MDFPNTPVEKDLLIKLRDGDETAFSQIFLTYYPALCLFAERYVGSESAEDIVENVFLKLLESGTLFSNTIHLKAYLFRSVRHSCFDLVKTSVRASGRNTAYAEAHNEPQTSYLAHIMHTEAMRILYQALTKLPEQTGKIITMTYLNGMSNQQAADELNVSINTIKTQKQRGLNKLRQILPKGSFALLQALIQFG